MPKKRGGWTPQKRRKAGKKAKATYKKKIGAARMAKRTKIAHRIEEEKAAGRIKGPREPYAVATEAVKPGGAKRMARKAVRTKGPAGRKRAARKAVATKRKTSVLKKAAKKAARTRKKRKGRKILGSAYKFAGGRNPDRYEEIRQRAIARGAPAGFVPFDSRSPKPPYGIKKGAGGMRGLIRQKVKEF